MGLSAPQAAASSGCTGDTANIQPKYFNAASGTNSAGTYTPGPGVTSMVLRGWGGGGGGGGGTGSTAGSGGGGAGFSQLTITGLTSCATYQVLAAPRYGEHLAWGDTGTVIYANAVCGARSNFEGPPSAVAAGLTRSEERRVGKEGRSRWAPYH